MNGDPKGDLDNWGPQKSPGFGDPKREPQKGPRYMETLKGTPKWKLRRDLNTWGPQRGPQYMGTPKVALVNGDPKREPQ